ncbi:MAG: DUF2156 domain-containing protein [Bryobacteraceae bacterium]|nr:DUF2156 domain-containing protein [Bryobacteraceae bacterium]
MSGTEPFSPSVELARELVIRHGWNATSYQILNPGIEHWFSPRHQAVVGYTRRADMLLVAGAPVCAGEALPAVCDEFEAFARQQGRRVCYVCAEERLRALFARSSHHATVALGAQPAWNPLNWSEVVRNRPSLRAQLHRAANKGLVVEAVSPARAAADPGLRRILLEWVAGRPLPPLHFLVEPNVLDGVLTDRLILTARRHGVQVAFLVASPARARAGYLIELLARSSSAPNGLSELLIHTAMRLLAAEGCRYVTLGLVALAHAADEAIRRNPRWLRTLMYYARACKPVLQLLGVGAVPGENVAGAVGYDIRHLQRTAILSPDLVRRGRSLFRHSSLGRDYARARESSPPGIPKGL